MIDIDKLARESGASLSRDDAGIPDWWVFSPDELQLFAEQVIQAAQAASAEEIKSLKAKLVPQDERLQEIKRLQSAQAAERERSKVLVDALLDYVQHDSWRCGYHGECRCGLNAITERFGLPAIPLPEKGDAK